MKSRNGFTTKLKKSNILIQWTIKRFKTLWWDQKYKKYFSQERKKMIEEQVIIIWSCLLAFMTKLYLMDYVICEKKGKKWLKMH